MLLWSSAPVYDSYAFKLLGTSFLRVNTGRVFTSGFQLSERVTTGNHLKTVTFPTRLKLSESANFRVNSILINFRPSNQVA